MILSVTFAHPIQGGPFAGGSDSWSHKRHFVDASEKVSCAESPRGVVLRWAGSGEHAGKEMRLTVAAANITQILEVEDDAAEAKKK